VRRVAIDSNILIYAELEPETDKGRMAANVITRVARDGVIPVQVLGEFLRFIQRRAPHALPDAVRQSRRYRATFITPPTTEATLETAAATVSAHGLQFWDAVICAASQAAGARALFTEDMQDGRVLGGLELINPFAPGADARIDVLLGA
jgi:predicted nucleic acid-binding protein